MAGRYGPRRRRSPLLSLLFVLVIVLVGYVLLTDSDFLSTLLPTEQSEAEAEEDIPPAESVLDKITVNEDGTFSATLTEPEVTSLVRRGLAESGGETVEDVSVDLRSPDGGASGMMVVDGRLADQGLPISATVDLEVDSGEIVPTVRDVKVGPVAAPGSVSDDMTRRLRSVDFLAGEAVRVDELSTTDSELRVSGQRA